MNCKKDILFNTIGNFSYLASLWLMSIIVVRMGDFEKAGYFSLAITVANIYISLASYTVRLYYATDINEKYHDNQYFLMRLFTTTLSFILCFIVSVLSKYDMYRLSVIMLFYIYKTAEMLSDILYGALQRHEKLYLSGYSLTMKSVMSLLCFSITMYTTKSLLFSIISIDVVAFLILLFVDIPIARKQKIRILPISKNDVCAAIEIMKITFPLFIVGVCYNILPSIPRLAFERIYSPAQFGIYSSISTITVLISTAINCIAVPFLPKFATYYHNHQKKQLGKLTLTCLGTVAVLGIIILFFAKKYGEMLLIVLFGKDMQGCLSIFLWVIIATLFTCIIIFFNDFFVAVNRQSIMLYGGITGTLFSAISAVPLCQKYYMHGVAYDLILSQGLEIFVLIIGAKWIMKKI